MKNRNERIDEFLSSLETEVDIMNCIDIDNIDISEAYDSIYNMIEESQGFDIEIIYYAKAMDYLSKNDASLNESLSIASELGFEVSSLNSETLASLLASQNVREEFYLLQDEIDDFFESLIEEAEGEE